MSAESALEPPLPAPTPLDEVERDLLKARTLVESAMSEHRRRLAAATVASTAVTETSVAVTEAADGDDPAAGAPRTLAESAREELVLVMAGGDWAAEVMPALPDLIRAGVAVRMLCAREALRVPWGIRLLGKAQAAGVQVRVAETALQELMLVDERAAAVRTGPHALVIRSPAMLRALRGLFSGAWESAVPVADRPRPPEDEDGWDGLQQRILTLLGAGYKDDAAARQLGLSVRTYRRHVAEIMRDVGAASRFQAGARAAELGLLPRA
ncbi:helix-turn-helix transcriptional regulator [Spirillospora sp. NPDC047279]|uniref:helix-turn-helix transcriptional regulator n=1 Tax=Spirillospora sp. NPDC047279 TaxID=3155478 RepID=UPI0033E5AA15